MSRFHSSAPDLAVCLLVCTSLPAQDLGGWVEPDDGWDYVYMANDADSSDLGRDEDVDGETDPQPPPNFNSLDDTWTHSNGSDAWDGSGPGDEFRPDGFTAAAPGGAGIVVIPGAAEDGSDAAVLSMVDTGDPRPRGFSDPSNRKMWFCHDVAQDLEAFGAGDLVLQTGLTLIIRSRLHPDVDPETPGWQLPDGGVDNDSGQGVAPGYTIRDGGKGGHGYYDMGLDRNFTMTPHGTTGYQLPPQVGEGLPPANFLDVGDNTVFHSMWVTIEDEDFDDLYTVVVYLDGAIDSAAIFEDIPLGDDTDCDGISHLHMGFHSTPQVGGFQVDYFGYKVGLHEPDSTCPGGLIASLDEETGEVDLTWSPGVVDSYTVRENGVDLQTGLGAGTTSFQVTNPARPTAKYEVVPIAAGAPKSECNIPTATVTTVVCPQLSCSPHAQAGQLMLDWTDPKFFTATGFAIMRDGEQIGTAAGGDRTFTDASPTLGDHVYELVVTSDPADACPVSPFCETRLFGPGTVDITGDRWDEVFYEGLAEQVTTDDGVKTLLLPNTFLAEANLAFFAVDVTSVGNGELADGRFRVEIRARYDNNVRIVNRSTTPESYVHFNLARTGVSTATDELGNQEAVEQVPNPGPPTIDSNSSTIVNTDTEVGLTLLEGLNLIEIRQVDESGSPTDQQVQIIELRIGPFAEGLEAELSDFPCPRNLTCTRDTNGRIELNWEANEPHSYDILRDGEVIDSIAIDETPTFTDDPGDGFFEYTVDTTDDPNCPDMKCTIGGGVPDEEGFIRDWLILGPLDWGCVSQCANPGEAIIMEDYLTGTSDGDLVDEVNIEPVAGMNVTPAQSTVRPTGRADINPNQPFTATWFPYSSPQSLLDFNAAFADSPDDNDNYVVYAVTYVDNTTVAPIEASIRLTSDDSVQLYLLEESVFVNNIARPADPLDALVDFVPDVILEPGINRVLAKVFEGGVDTALAVRFEDDFGTPLTGDHGLRVTLDPFEEPPEGDFFRRGDTDANGVLEVTDPINNLSFQFLGTFQPPCKDAADFDDNGKIEITDPIGNLSHQFLGQAPPPAPGKDDCGVDPTPDDGNGNGTPGEPDDDLGCEIYPAPGGRPCN